MQCQNLLVPTPPADRRPIEPAKATATPAAGYRIPAVMAVAVASISQAADAGRFAVCRQGTSCDLFARWLASAKPAGKKNVRGERSRPRSLPALHSAGSAKEPEMTVPIYRIGKRWWFTPPEGETIDEQINLDVAEGAIVKPSLDGTELVMPPAPGKNHGIRLSANAAHYIATQSKPQHELDTKEKA